MSKQFQQNRLNTILSDLCSEFELPVVKAEQNPEIQAKQLIELVEENNYPYPPLSCPHRIEKRIDEDCVECIYQQYEIHKDRYVTLMKEKGENHTHTLKAAFDFYTSLITQYKLTECDELITTIYPACIAKGKTSRYYILAVQARAFLRFKQGKFQESLEDFHKQIDVLGPHDAIYENMALVYSRLNQFKEARACYARAILLIQQSAHEEERFATLLMGLSTVLENIDDVLIILQESLRLLRKRFSRPHSLIAKTLSAMGDAYTKKEDLQHAEQHYREAVSIFIETCGLDTPLTANAMTKQARALFSLDHHNKAIEMAIQALAVWVQVDTISFETNSVFENLYILRETHQNPLSSQGINVLKALQEKIEDNNNLNQDLNILCLLKFISEIFILNKNLNLALKCCQSFSDCLNRLIPTNDLLPIRDKLLQENDKFIMILKSIPPK